MEAARSVPAPPGRIPDGPPTLAIIPLALLLSWFGPSPSGETGPLAMRGMSEAPASLQAEPSATEQLAQAWESIQRGDFLQATSEVPQRR